MSRIGRAPISIPAGVEIKVEDNNVVTVKGPKGTLTQQFNPNMAIAIEDGVLHVTRPNDAKENRALHGLTRTLLHNMVVGVTEGFKKELDVKDVYKRQEMSFVLVTSVVTLYSPYSSSSCAWKLLSTAL